MAVMVTAEIMATMATVTMVIGAVMTTAITAVATAMMPTTMTTVIMALGRVRVR